jgi:flagellar hook-associated protein 3 FlgL
MIGRITSQQILYSSQQNIASSKLALSQLENEASSGVALTKPSDNPAATSTSLAVRSQISANTQYGTNISDGLGWLATTDSTLTSSEQLLTKAISLTTQAANTGTSSTASNAAISTQLEGLKTDLLNQANTNYLGRSLFAGNSDSSTAVDTTTYATSGVTGSTVQRRVDSALTVPVSADAASAYGSGATSVFAHIDAINTAIAAGDTAGIQSGITALQADLSTMTAAHSVVGSNYARLQTAQTQNTSNATSLESQRSGIEDADVTKVIIDLKSQELAYQTALSVTAQSIQPTLMSFLQ